MLQSYVFAIAGFFLSYWFLKPSYTFILLVCIHLFIFGGIQLPVIHNALEYAEMRPLAIVVGTAISFFVTRMIRKPEFVFFSRRYVLSCLAWIIWTAGTLLSWQVAPKTFWNYIFLCAVPQLLSIVASYLFINHAETWDEGPRTQFTVHYHYLALWLCFTLPYVIGQLVWSHLPTYYWTFVSYAASLVWLMIHAFFIIVPLPATVTVRSLVVRSDADGLLVDKRWSKTDTDLFVSQQT